MSYDHAGEREELFVSVFPVATGERASQAVRVLHLER